MIRNNGVGVQVDGAASGVSIRGNSIFGNDNLAGGFAAISGLGIDLGAPGIDPIDPGDADTGPNGLQNAPAITGAATAPWGFSVFLSLVAAPGPGLYSVDFYLSAACDDSGAGEGAVYIGTQLVAVSSTAPVNFSKAFPFAPPPGSVVAATVTSPNGSTSEFSDCAAVD